MKKNSSLNHTYRLVWNELTQAFVAVAEHTSGRGKRASGALLLSAVLATGAQAQAPSAQAPPNAALPSGGHVVAGQAQLTQSGSQLLIQQATDKLIMNWGQFNIGSEALVRFEQPGASSVALNRVTGAEASAIFGKLQANGQVWLVNPSGVVFGRGAAVDVGGLVASSLAIADSDFLAGRARFVAEAGAEPGAIHNFGRLSSQGAGGVVALIAPRIDNSGEIHTPGGSTLLGAGSQVSLDFAGDGLVSLNVEAAALQAQIGHSGEIHAAGGLVQLSAQAAGELRASVVNSSGVIEARGLSSQGGRILLDGGEHGELQLSGSLDAGSDAGRGGQIKLAGEHIRLHGGATLEASGTGLGGGGQIHVGGGWQGLDKSHANASSVKADASVQARANAGQQGQGGEVVFWSDGRSEFAGRIEVRGGAESGDGGRAEVSGKQQLAYSGRTDARATRGRTGDLLLDPSTLEIRGGGDGSGSLTDSVVYEKDIEAQLANVLLQATGDILVQDLNLGGGDGKITMQNNVSLRIEAGTANGGHLTPPAGLNDGSFQAYTDLMFANASNTLEVFGSGSLMLVAGSTNSGRVLNVPVLRAHGAGSNVATLPGHSVTSPGDGTPAAGSITAYGADGVTVGGSLNTNGGYVRIWADSDNGGAGYFTLSAPVNTNGGNLYISTGSGDVTLNSNMVLGSGRVLFRADGSYTNGNKILAGLMSVSGDVNIDTPFIFKGGASIHTDGKIAFGSVNVNMDTGDGVLTLRAEQIDWGTATLQNLSTASMRLEPADPARNMVLGDTNGFASATTLAKLPGIKNLTVGREDGTGTISVPSDFSFNASGHFEMVNRTVDITAGTLSNLSGNITLTGDTLNINQTVTANGGAGKVTLRQMTAANELHLGTGLSNATLGRINAATLEVGRSDGGNLVFDNDISTPATTVHLKSGQRVIGVDGGVSAANIAVTAGAGATLTDDSFNFSTLALEVGGNSELRQLGAGGWGLGTVDGLNGLVVKTGSAPTISLQAQGRLGLNAGLNFNGTASTLQLHSADGFAAESAALSNQGRATLEFSVSGANPAVTVGGASGHLNRDSIAKLGGVDTLRVLAGDDSVQAGDFSVAVGNKVDIQAERLDLNGAISISSGSLHLTAALGGLDLDHELNAAATLSLNDQAGSGIQGGAALTAAKLALRSSGVVQLNSGTHMVGEIAADVGRLSYKNDRSLTVGSADGLDGVRADASVILRSLGAASDLILNQAVTAGNNGQEGVPLLLAAGRNFVNNAGAGALQASGGAWRVFSSDPRQDNRGGLSPDFKQYNANLASTVLGSGNGMLYTVAPQLQVQLTGTVSKTYDGNDSATLQAGNFVISGGIDGDQLDLSAGQAHYADKNAGSGKNVSVSGLTVSASKGSAQVYGYAGPASTASGNIGSITQRTINPGALLVADKVYDGNTVAQLQTAGFSGAVAGDVLNLSGTAAFQDKQAGTNKNVLISGLTLGGADAGNYQLSSNQGSSTASITPKSISAGASSAATKVYDGTTQATVTAGSLQGLIGADQVSLQSSGEFLDKNAGRGKTVTVNLRLTGADAGNYQLTQGTQTAQADINARLISAGAASVANKVYDGNTQATVTAGALQGLIAGDQVDLRASGEFADKNVGRGKSVAVSLDLGGADAGNYRLNQPQQNAQAEISVRQLSASAATVASKVYDGNTHADVQFGTLQGLVAGDQVAVQASGQFADKHAGRDKAVAVSLSLSGQDAGNYQLDSSTQTRHADISAKRIQADPASVAGKVYDGNTQATVTAGALQGLIAGDSVGVQASGQFVDKNAGLGKAVDVTLKLDGKDAGNYQLDAATQAAKADISAKRISADAAAVAGKVYDGNTTAEVRAGALQGLIAGDSVGVQAGGQFADKNAGLGKAVTVTLKLDGKDAGNYQLDAATQAAKADISAKRISADAAAVAGKVYDGNTAAEVKAGALQGLIAGDSVGVQAGGQFADKNAGLGKAVTVTLKLDGKDAGNYQLDAATQAAKADIAQRSLSGQPLVASSKRYDGTTQADLGPVQLGGVLAGDQVQATVRGQYLDPAVGQDKPVQIAAVSLSGSDAGNYRLDAAGLSAKGTITAPPASDAVGSVSVTPLGGNGTQQGSAGAGRGGSASTGTGSGGAGAGGAGGSAGGTDAPLIDLGELGGGQGAAGGAGAGAEARADSAVAGKGKAAAPGFDTEQALSDGGRFSIALDRPALEQPLTADVPLFTQRGAAAVESQGQVQLSDLGDSLAVTRSSALPAALPAATSGLRYSGEALLVLPGSRTGSLRLSFGEDGSLRVQVPAAAAGLGHELLSAYALSALKRDAGIGIDQVRSLLLSYTE